jgi:hypothetical protein
MAVGNLLGIFLPRRMIMSDMLPSATRRAVLAASAAAGAASLLPAQASAATDSTAIRPFHIKISNEALIDLRKRIVATKFPERETVADATRHRR